MRHEHRPVLVSLLLCCAAPLAGCGGSPGIQPSSDDYSTVQNALLNAAPGSTVTLGAGTFHFTQQLSLDVANVTLAGQGSGKTILDFTGQTSGDSAIHVTASGFTAQDFAIVNPTGDGLDMKGVVGNLLSNLHVQRLSVSWTAAPSNSDGPYGIYPVLCNNILIENNDVAGASDTGIYIGQSQNIVVRNNTVHKNVAGIEIENSHYADVYGNTATENSGGILVFGLPGLAVEGGGSVRVYDNQIISNNTANFALAGDTVKQVPGGTGTFVMANKGVEIFNNTITGNWTDSMSVISYLLTGMDFSDDPNYDPYTYAVYMHDNTVSSGGTKPGFDGNQLGLALGVYVVTTMYPSVPDQLTDGFIDPSIMPVDPTKPLTNDNLPADLQNCFHNNTDGGMPATFADVDGAALLQIEAGMNVTPTISRDITPYDCTQPALPAVTLTGGLQ